MFFLDDLKGEEKYYFFFTYLPLELMFISFHLGKTNNTSVLTGNLK